MLGIARIFAVLRSMTPRLLLYKIRPVLSTNVRLSCKLKHKDKNLKRPSGMIFLEKM